MRLEKGRCRYCGEYVQKGEWIGERAYLSTNLSFCAKAPLNKNPVGKSMGYFHEIRESDEIKEILQHYDQG